MLIDIHTMKDSQNGFDNSGQSMGFQWTTALNREYTQDHTFEHWPIRDARWIGTFDQETASYSSINYDNIRHSLEVIERIVDRYKTHPTVQGIEVGVRMQPFFGTGKIFFCFLSPFAQFLQRQIFTKSQARKRTVAVHTYRGP